MYTIVNEPISVGAIFSSGKITPRFFIWDRKKYQVEKVTYFWRSKTGNVPILHFTVTNDESVYEISYNSGTARWHLERVYAE